MDRETALAKIHKCLALSKSAEPHEAAAALRQAQKLMAQFGLDGTDLELSQIRQHSKDVPAGALSAWQSKLAHLVAGAFGCGLIWTKEPYYLPDFRVRHTRAVIFYGADAAAEVACYVWDVLLRQCIRARKAHIKSQPKACKPATLTARGDRFALGWVAGVSKLVQAMATGDEQRQELLQQYEQRTWPNSKTVKATRRDVGKNVRPDDWICGAAAGANADLRRGVAGRTEAQALPGVGARAASLD